jgi:hypothetical protein
MDLIPNALHFELSIPAGTNEQEFLRLVVQTAIKKYRTLLDRTPSLVTTNHLFSQINTPVRELSGEQKIV